MKFLMKQCFKTIANALIAKTEVAQGTAPT
jgi:hypothetical protein